MTTLRCALAIPLVLLIACEGTMGGVANDVGSATVVDDAASHDRGLASDGVLGTDSGDPSWADTRSSDTAVFDASSGDTLVRPGTSDHLLWLFDGETGEIGGANQRHDGGVLAVCERHREEAAAFVDAPEPHTGRFFARFHMEASWLWGRGTGCTAKVRSRLRSPEGIVLEEGAGYWLGWAVRLADDWELPTGRHTVMSIHPTGDGPSVRVDYDEEMQAAVWFKSGLGERTEFAEIRPGVWTEYVLRFVMAHDDRGAFHLWFRPQGDAEWGEAIDYRGPTMVERGGYPVIAQLGVIGRAGEWSDPGAQRTVHLDEARLGTDAAGFEVVTPGSGYRLAE